MASVRAKELSLFPFRSCYHVFLSFRGEDTRLTFVDHLYTALVHGGIRTFRDDKELKRGEKIALELEKAIRESRISIVVFSKDYASSRWCLDELLMILERKKTVGHIILPIFYHVDPSQVRKQTGSFAKALALHKKRFNSKTEKREEGMAKLENWKAALREVADLPGMVFKDGNESKFVQKIVKEIAKRLNRTILSVASYPIGIDSRVKDINLWLQDGSTDVGVVTICGMGGVGKTTIAKAAYNLNYDRFEGGSFLANIKEVSERPNGLISLQKQLLSDILKAKGEKISNVDEGIVKIQNAVSLKRILVVFDDVDQVSQLNAVLAMREWFHPGSKIIITTRHERLLKNHQQHKIHKVKELNDDESFELFCWHAFGQDHPIEDYMEHSKRVVKHCRGIPLALQVLGSSLSGRSVDVWESALKKLEAIPDSEILKKLKISYDCLQDDHDKNLFLDIACFFAGEDKEFAITILDECDFCTEVGIDNLIDRCLLTIEKDDELAMHQLLRDMGREIIRQESPKDPGKRSRVWHHKDAFNVLEEKSGTETIEGFIFNLQPSHASKEEKLVEKLFRRSNAKRQHSNDFLDNSALHSEGNPSKRRRLGPFSWLPISSILPKKLSSSNGVDLKTDAFSRMHRLRLLQLYNVRLTGSYEEFPKKLRWLRYHGFSSKSIPDEFPLESMVALELFDSSLEKVWKRTKLLKSLKILNLSHSHALISTPDFSKLPNLVSLILEECINLIEVHESIGELRSLVLLNLEDCKKLRKLPIKSGQLKSLKVLILSGCSNLQLPTGLGELKSLTVLEANSVGINELPSTTGLWCWVSKPRESPKSISFSLASLSRLLTTLSLADCNLSDDAIPRDISRFSLLQNLILNENPICSLPDNIKDLTFLQSFGLARCTRLRSLPELPISLRYLSVDSCKSLEKVTNLPNLMRSLDLWMNGCDNLVVVQGLFKLEPIGNYGAEIINKLDFFNLESMRNVEVDLFNTMTLTNRKFPLQGLFEFGIFSLFLPVNKIPDWSGNRVPDWFRNENKGSSVCFNVPSLPNLKIQGLNICVVYYSEAGFDFSDAVWNQFYIKISNKSKDLKWTYSPTVIGIPDDGKDMLWFSNWNIGNQLESGNEVHISVFFRARFKRKEIGAHIVYEQEEEGSQYTYASSQNVIDDGSLSEYQVETGSYFFCHHLHDAHQECLDDDDWTDYFDLAFGASTDTLCKYFSDVSS